MEKNELKRRAYAANRRASIRLATRGTWGGGVVSAGDSAKRALDHARGYVERPDAKLIFTSESIWQAMGAAGNVFRPTWSPSTACRWIEIPESVGLRLVGFADEIPDTGIKHSGWFTNDFQDETLRGVVFQISGRDGRARFLSGYACPCNPPAAMIDMDIQESDNCRGDESAADDTKRDAARHADRLAELSAESERWYQESWQHGTAARELAGIALATGRTYVETLRTIKADRSEICVAFRERFEAVRDGVPLTMTREWIRAAIREIRDTLEPEAESELEQYQSERDAARSAISDHGHGWNSADAGAFWEAYGEGV